MDILKRAWGLITGVLDLKTRVIGAGILFLCVVSLLPTGTAVEVVTFVLLGAFGFVKMVRP